MWGQGFGPAADLRIGADDRPNVRHRVTATAGTGAAKGAGNLAKGTAKGAVDLATLHPIDAATSVAGGAASAGKNVAVGTATGAGKITRGVGRAIKKVL